jgi:hypothetical protein
LGGNNGEAISIFERADGGLLLDEQCFTRLRPAGQLIASYLISDDWHHRFGYGTYGATFLHK